MEALGKVSVSFACLFVLFGAAMSFDGKLQSRICSADTYAVQSSYDIGVKYTLFNIMESTPKARGHDYYHVENLADLFSQNGVIHSHGSCNQSLKEDDCYNCPKEAIKKLLEKCTNNTGAQIKIDCRIR